MKHFDDIEDKERYLIQPYIEGEYRKIILSTKNGVVTVISVDENDKKAKLDNKIKKEISKAYSESKFFRYETILEGVLSKDKKNRTYLILFDIFLKDEYIGKLQSKRYDIRYENLMIRFLNKNLKYVKAIFSHKFNSMTVDLIIEQFIKTDTLNKLIFRKNIPKGYEEDEFFEYDVWTPLKGRITNYTISQGSKKEFDDQQKLISETPFNYLSSLQIFCEDEQKSIDVELTNFSESEKINMLDSANDLLNKECIFKRYNVLNKEGYIFIALKNI